LAKTIEHRPETAPQAPRRGRPRWPRALFLALSSLLSIVLAAILVFAPGAGALGITWAIGWYALLASGVLAAQAWRLKQRRQHAPSFTPGTAPSR